MTELLVVESLDTDKAVIRFNTPENKNAGSIARHLQLEEAVSSLAENKAIRTVILTGSGDSFSAGGDINFLNKVGPVEGRKYCMLGHRVTRAMENSPQVYIAAINGFALGGGLEWALACDFRVATESAVLGLPEPRLGLLAGYGGVDRLIRSIGKGHAMEMLLTGGRISARRALDIGLINYLYSDSDEMMRSVAEIADRVTKCAPLAVEYIKSCVSAGQDLGLDAALKYEADMWALLCSTNDKAEGTASFLEKRKPQFRGE